MAYKDIAKRRLRDRERYRRRSAERTALGLCPKCGKQAPAPDRAICQPCADRTNKASRARDARLRAEGRPVRDPAKARASQRRRYRRRVEERREAGTCTLCGKASAAAERSLCDPCAEKRRARERARYRKAAAAGALYGGRNPDTRRRAGRASSSKRRRARQEAGRCERCGSRPPVAGGMSCEPCRQQRRASGKRFYDQRRQAGLCTRCCRPTIDGGSRCARCAVLEAERSQPQRKNAASRYRYWARRAAGRCTDCNRPSQGAARCEPCATRSHERSQHFRGLPSYPPRYTVMDPVTGDDLGTWDSWEDVAVAVAYSRLSLDRVEVLVDRSPMDTLTAWT